MIDNPQNPAIPPQPTGLSDAELRATLYFAVGVTSESGYAAYQLAVAGDRAATPALEPADNSGYTIGTLQTDMGQHYRPNVPGGENVPRDLVNAYQNWARSTHPDWVLTDLEAQQTISDLGRNGNAIRAQQGRAVDATVKSRIDSFLSTDDGINWVHARDVAQANKLMDRVITPLQRSDVYQNASADDQVRLAVIVGKAFNQNEDRSTALIEAIERNQYQSVAEVNAAVNNLSPRRTGDYFEQGRDKALLGANVVNSLRNTGPDNPLSSAWQNVLANPLVNPTLLNQDQAHPNLDSEYPTVKGLFLHYDRAQPFTESLERGGAYQNAPVDRQNPSQFTGAGFYASGNDFVTWNRNGEGHAYIGGAWSEVDRSDLTRTRNADQTTDLNINRNGTIERLLHVDPDAPVLRPVQQPVGLAQPTPDLFDRVFEALINKDDAALRTARIDYFQSADGQQLLQDGRELRHAQERKADAMALAQGRPLPNGYSIGTLTGKQDPRDWDHSDHALYSAIRQQLPREVSDDMAAHVMLQARQAGIRDVDRLEHVSVHDNKVFVSGRNFLGMTSVDLSQTPPPMEDTVQQSQRLDQQLALERQQWLAQQQEQARNGPSMSL